MLEKYPKSKASCREHLSFNGNKLSRDLGDHESIASL